MSIKPIDLQTMFLKIEDVGKEQSQIKEQSALQQAESARAQVLQELEEDRRVIETASDDEAQDVKEEEPGSEKKPGKKKHGKNKTENKKIKEVVTDPDIGRHVDLTG